jgi:protein SCO1/2
MRRGGANVTVLIVMVVSGFVTVGVVIAVVLLGSVRGSLEHGMVLNSQDPEVVAYLRTLKIRSFEMRDQDGAARTDEVLRGQHTVLAFTFTNCKTACPVMSANLLRVYHETSSLGYRVVSISVDPVHDTPEVLGAYADNLGIDTARWVFLTGEASVVNGIVTEDLGFAQYEDAASPIVLADGSQMANIVHPTKFLLLDPEGEIIGMYSGMDPEGGDQLVIDLRRLERAAR